MTLIVNVALPPPLIFFVFISVEGYTATAGHENSEYLTAAEYYFLNRDPEFLYLLRKLPKAVEIIELGRAIRDFRLPTGAT